MVSSEYQEDCNNLFDGLELICAKFPAMKKHLFASDTSHKDLIFSTAIWVNGNMVAHEEAALKKLKLSHSDIVEIEPAIVGG